MADPEDDDLAALRERTSRGDRIDADSDAADRRALVEDILTELEAIDAGEQQKTVSVWDGHLAAFIRALENNPERMAHVSQALQQHLNVDQGDAGRSDLIRLALRVGLQEAAPETFDALRQAAKDHAARNL